MKHIQVNIETKFFPQAESVCLLQQEIICCVSIERNRLLMRCVAMKNACQVALKCGISGHEMMRLTRFWG